MKKVSFVASMLLVALSTAGAMVAGQSFAAQNDKAPCVDARGIDSLSPDQIERHVESLRTQG